MNWTADALIATVGIITSLLFAYLPFLREWYDNLDRRWKPLIHAGLLFIVDVGYFVITYRADWAELQPRLGEIFGVFVAALVANQTTFQVAVKQFKEAEYWNFVDSVNKQTEKQ